MHKTRMNIFECNERLKRFSDAGSRFILVFRRILIFVARKLGIEEIQGKFGG